MARVTVEDCIEKVSSRFELVVLAAKRTRQIAAGAPLTIERNNDKDAVVALREIAEETISTEDLNEAIIASYRQYSPMEDREEELEDLLERELRGDNNTSSRTLQEGWIPDSSPPDALFTKSQFSETDLSQSGDAEADSADSLEALLSAELTASGAISEEDSFEAELEKSLDPGNN